VPCEFGAAHISQMLADVSVANGGVDDAHALSFAGQGSKCHGATSSAAEGLARVGLPHAREQWRTPQLVQPCTPAAQPAAADGVPVVLRQVDNSARGDRLVVDPGLAEQLQRDFEAGVHLPKVADAAVERAKVPQHLRDMPDDDLQQLFAAGGTASISLDRTKLVLQGPDLRWMRELLCEWDDIFSVGAEPGRSPFVQVHIDVPLGTKPVRSGRPITNPKARAVVEEHVRNLCKKGILRPANSAWSSSLFFVPKKDGKTRVTQDTRAINRLVPRLSYGLPRLAECTNSLAGAKYVSNCDIKDAYWTLPLTAESQDYFAISTHVGQFAPTRLPQGYRNSQALFVHFVDQIVLQGFIGQIAFSYCDDIIIYSKDLPTHMRDLRLVFERMRFHNLKLNASKCEFAVPDTVYLSHDLVADDGVRPAAKNVRAILEMPVPTNKQQLSAFVHGAAYYRMHMPRFATVMDPLQRKLLKCPRTFELSPLERQAFDEIRAMLCSRPLLAYPDFDLPFEIHVDASGVGVSAILCQRHTITNAKGKQVKVERVVSYASKALRGPQLKYSQYERKGYALVWGCEVYRHLVIGSSLPIVVYTDNEAITWLSKQSKPNRLMRWMIQLEEFNLDVKHRPGLKHANADFLSRLPLPADIFKTKDIPALMASHSFRLNALLPPDALDSVPQHLAASPLEDELLMHPVSVEVLAREQRSDARCSKLIAHLKSPGVGPDFSNHYVFEEAHPGATTHLLFRVDTYKLPHAHSVPRKRFVVPASLVNFVLRHHHGAPVTGHMGRTRTLEMVCRNFYWRGMSKDVRKWVAACLPCRKRKTPRPRGGASRPIMAQRPFEIVAMDFVGPFEETEAGYKYLLVMVDLFTRWPIAIPCLTETADETADNIIRYLTSVHGFPKHIMTDKGPGFIRAGLKRMYARLGIHPIYTSGWQPQSNGVCERTNRYINAALSCVVNAYKNDWEYFVDTAIFAHRVSVSSSTGYSPFELLYLRKPTLPVDLLFGVLPPPEADSDSEYFLHKTEHMKKIFDATRVHQDRMARIRKQYVDAKRTAVLYTPDDTVLFWEPNRADITEAKKQRLRFHWTGPHVVRERISPMHYKIARGGDDSKVVLVNVNRLSPFEYFSADLPSTEPPFYGQEYIPYKISNPAERVLKKGCLFVIKLAVDDDNDLPFGVGRVLTMRRTGDVDFQWYGNTANSLLGCYQPLWLPREGEPYAAAQPRAAADKPYRGHDTGSVVERTDVLVPRFQLIDQRIPHDVLVCLSEEPSLDWCLPELSPAWQQAQACPPLSTPRS
jgi:hypothetical protein